MTFSTHGTQDRIKANIALFIMTICVFIHPHSATSLSGRSHHQNKSYNTTGQRVNTVNETATNGTSSVVTNKQYYPVPPNEPWSKSTFGSDSPENAGLLIDPSYPLSRTLSPDQVQVLKPSKVISSALLTAATPSPTAPNISTINSENLKNHSSHDVNDTRKFPLLSGSMTISLPTPTPPVPAPAPGSSNTVIAFVTADATPTTSTAFVYATTSPIHSTRPKSSASSCTVCKSSYRKINSGLLVVLILTII